MAVFGNIDGEESATVTFRVAAVSIDRGSTSELQEILVVGDPDTSNAITRVTQAAPASTNAGMNVRIVSGPSSLADFSVRAVLPSTATDNPFTFTSTHSVQAKNSTIGDLLASVQQNSTVWQTQNRPVFPSILSTSQLITSTHSTAVYELKSSEAGVRQKVCAYFVGSTHTNPSTLVFMSSLASDRWHVNFGSGSSGMTGANLANAIPIFVTDAANALNCRIEGGSSVTATVVTRVSFSYVTEA